MKQTLIYGCTAIMLLAAGLWPTATRAAGVDFEDLSLAPESSWFGEDSLPYPADNLGEEHPFTSRGVEFYNYYIDGYAEAWQSKYTYWEGWAYSNKTDTVTPGYGNQFSAIAGGGVAGSSNFGVVFLPDTMDPSLDPFRRVDVALAHTDTPGRYGFYVTNTTYDYYAIRDGDQFTRKFGHTWDSVNEVWVDTKEKDYFKLVVTGLDAESVAIPGLEVPFYLADFRFPDNADDYIVDDWTWVDLASLVEGGAQELQFVLDSSDAGAYGINTPLYVAVDAVPEPATPLMLLFAALSAALWWRRRKKRDT